MENRDKAISVAGLTKRFGSFTAVDHITFDVGRGEIFGFLGANGAGKTTAMRMLCGLSVPTSPIPWINFPLMSRAGEIENAVMILHGEKAHSFYFGSDAYKKLTVTPGKENNKLFMVLPGASHTDLYDRKDIIPFAAIENFFREYLGK